jgi:hypothetical protein
LVPNQRAKTGSGVSFISIFFPAPRNRPGKDEKAENFSFRPTSEERAFVEEICSKEGLDTSDVLRRLQLFAREAADAMQPYALLFAHEADQQGQSVAKVLVGLAVEQLEKKYPELTRTIGKPKK